MFKSFSNKNKNLTQSCEKMGICLKVHSFVINKYFKKLLYDFTDKTMIFRKNIKKFFNP